MPVFRYKAYDASGRIQRGTIDEETRKAAVNRLKQQRLVPVDVEAVHDQGPGAGGRSRRARTRVSLKDVAMFTRQLATLVNAGLPLVEALTAAVETTDPGPMQTVAAQVRDHVNEGSSLADALRRYPRAFNDLYVNMVRAGEESGTLEIVLERLADFLDGQIELRNQITGTLAYPAIMFLMMLGVLGVLFVFVIPQIVQVFDQTGQELPLPTKVLIGTTTLVSEYGGLILVALAALAYGVHRWLQTPAGRARWDRLRLRLPVLGMLFENIALSRFARTLSTLLSSGVSLPVSLKIVREVVGNTVYADAVDRVYDAVVEGGGLAKPLRNAGVFPSTMVRMVAAGEQSGELEDMLGRVAHAYDREVELRLSIVTRLLEPIMIVVMGGMVFFIMLSILIPMFQINQFV
ncbi:MAG: type II secretion system protein GspF [Candidatus Dadabacteria bacterium]|nr:MAG: type II secretion system protein GspF [Candidatus Dadabacteria bacterium]